MFKSAVAIVLLLGQYPTGSITVRDEGTNKGKAVEVNCTGAGVTCSQSAWRWTINVPGGGGGGGAGLPADPAACSAGQYVYDQDANGVLSCSTPPLGLSADPSACPAGQYVTDQDAGGALTCAQVAYSQVSGTPTIPSFPLSAANGGTGQTVPTDDAILIGNGTTWNKSVMAVSCNTFRDALSYNPTTNTMGCNSNIGAASLNIDPNACPAGQYVTDISSTVASNMLTCGQVQYSQLGGAPVSLSGEPYVTTAASANLSNEQVVPTCSGTDKLTFNGTALSCATDQTVAGGAYALVQDEGTPLTARSTINFIGAGVTCADNGGATRTDCTITSGGGGGAPGGSSGQVQYNNASAFAGISEVESDGTNFVFVGTTTEPAAPAAGRLKLWAMQPHGANAPVLPYWKGGTTQVDYRLFPKVLSTDPVWGCIQPAAHGSTTLTVSGSMQAGGATGTAAAVAWASTDARTRAKWVQYPTTAAVNLNAGYRANTDYVWRGSAANLGGFYVWGSMNIVTGNAGQRVFMGLKDATAVLTAASDPNAALDTVYFGANAADTNLSICSNDNAGTATCTTLGASFPAKTANSAYDVAFWAAPNGSTIGYSIRHVVSGAVSTGTLSTDLPRNTIQLGFDFNINSGTGAVVTTMQFGGTCYIANP